MTKDIRLFEKQPDGRLCEVDRDVQGARRVSRVALQIDVMWTAEEEAERDAEEKAEAEAREKAAAEDANAADPKEKLRQFLANNPDVVSLIE